MSQPREFERQIYDNSLQLQGRLYGYCPVQAEGVVMGKRFYFRARWDGWSFSAADTEDVDPIDIQLGEQGFFREGAYGQQNQDEASWMPYDDAAEIIKRCAEEYVASIMP
ncbi:MAG: hypothetical protein JO316_05465 [Abitibacteriaceae bacterium]|nr:hypothetical protein [Abditibacteriaceae bacterium]MBV9864775.1 hypothetical protein [Abditibacteriaceae bacterium]